MKRAALLTVILATLVASPASALADGAGHNAPTKKLEAAFTIALTERINSSDGCYPAPRRLAKVLSEKGGFKAGVAARAKSISRRGILYVVRAGSSCNGVRMALRVLRLGRNLLYVLDSVQGSIKVIGKRRGPDPRIAQNRGPLRALTLVEKTFEMAVPHRRDRLVVRCPGETFPLGGGMVTSPPLGADGEGIYPHSYERLGAQRGWHITAWLMDPSAPLDASRNVAVQAVCGKGLVPMRTPHRTKFTLPGETKTVVARCPTGHFLMSGGFQRFDFLHDGGNYVTESRAISSKAWRVSGTAYGEYGGELTAIAYCARGKKPLLREVSASAPLPMGSAATATTPRCPKGRRLTSGGFSANGSQQTFFAGASINGDNTWTAHGYGFFGSAPALTAYGYCLRPGV
jgi:hypothetical protein